MRQVLRPNTVLVGTGPSVDSLGCFYLASFALVLGCTVRCVEQSAPDSKAELA